SNASTLTGDLPAYSISNLSLEKTLRFPLPGSSLQSQHSAEGVSPNSPKSPLTLQLKLAVNNLFDAEYLSVLSRPMPGTNLEFFLSLAW
ncbi:MAG: hypothetical protein K2M16_05600, partial [Muribaculaceae bacterium]|nr:hypothetical protein [Muribaculaceae bacterium]